MLSPSLRRGWGSVKSQIKHIHSLNKFSNPYNMSTLRSTTFTFSFHPSSILASALSTLATVDSDRDSVVSAAPRRISNSAAFECSVDNSSSREASAGRWAETPLSLSIPACNFDTS